MIDTPLAESGDPRHLDRHGAGRAAAGRRDAVRRLLLPDVPAARGARHALPLAHAGPLHLPARGAHPLRRRRARARAPLREPREAIYAHMPGIKVVIPSGPRNARALLVAAIRDPDPVVFMEPKRSYRAFREEVPEEEETLPIGQAQVVQEGADLTVVTWGAMMRADAAGDRRGPGPARGLDRADRPADASRRSTQATIAASVKKTGRCVVVQEAPRFSAPPPRSSRRINDSRCSYLEAPVKRVTGYDVVTPYFGREEHYIPGPDKRRSRDRGDAGLLASTTETPPCSSSSCPTSGKGSTRVRF